MWIDNYFHLGLMVNMNSGNYASVASKICISL